MTTDDLTLEKLTDSVGAAVHGVDRDRLLHDDDLPGWTLDALEANGALVFPGLHLDDEAQVLFSRKLGKVEIFGDGEWPEIFVVTMDPARSKSAQYLKATVHWHIDGCTDDIPIMATMLSAHAVATTGGETEFASSYQAYEDLSDDEKAHCETLRVVHTIEASYRLIDPDPPEAALAMMRQRPAKNHPLVWTHRSGRKSLVLGATADHVVGMEADESRALLDSLLDRATAPDKVYRHEWAVGDLVIWDNRGVLHRALPYDEKSPRDMHRTTFTGDEAIQ